ncbi:hypothetical protein PCASD_21286 [Puccinia coronata f. sp. avenae]|uniref:Uncharacterized protein n=1 Tax=Puccinia coronata f. sp. avenae TaxID=200324 RepID=A0A2N5TX51_9BASI|nr:hypothetical protein PCASD_21286 [Puccinia coronata f. sp. avenae]
MAGIFLLQSEAPNQDAGEDEIQQLANANFDNNFDNVATTSSHHHHHLDATLPTRSIRDIPNPAGEHKQRSTSSRPRSSAPIHDTVSQTRSQSNLQQIEQQQNQASTIENRNHISSARNNTKYLHNPPINSSSNTPQHSRNAQPPAHQHAPSICPHVQLNVEQTGRSSGTQKHHSSVHHQPSTSTSNPSQQESFNQILMTAPTINSGPVINASASGNRYYNNVQESNPHALPASPDHDGSFPLTSAPEINTDLFSYPLESESGNPCLSAYNCMERQHQQIIHELLPSATQKSWLPVTDAKIVPFQLTPDEEPPVSPTPPQRWLPLAEPLPQAIESNQRTDKFPSRNSFNILTNDMIKLNAASANRPSSLKLTSFNFNQRSDVSQGKQAQGKDVPVYFSQKPKAIAHPSVKPTSSTTTESLTEFREEHIENAVNLSVMDPQGSCRICGAPSNTISIQKGQDPLEIRKKDVEKPALDADEKPKVDSSGLTSLVNTFLTLQESEKQLDSSETVQPKAPTTDASMTGRMASPNSLLGPEDQHFAQVSSKSDPKSPIESHAGATGHTKS